jgi:hypothetical protein
MRIERFITLELAKQLEKEIAEGAIKCLIEMKDGLMGGDDSGLKSIWEELCVQVQGEESIFFEEYIDIVENFIEHAITNKQRVERMVLWLATDDGFDWVSDHFSDEDSDQNLPLDMSVIVEKIASNVIRQASDFESESIYNYLHQLEGDDDEEEEEEEDEDDARDALLENQKVLENEPSLNPNVLALDAIASLKKGKSDFFYISPPVQCHICGIHLATQKYFVDGRRKSNSGWACMCPDCFSEHGESVGWGIGQLYLNQGNASWLQVGG